MGLHLKYKMNYILASVTIFSVLAQALGEAAAKTDKELYDRNVAFDKAFLGAGPGFGCFTCLLPVAASCIPPCLEGSAACIACITANAPACLAACGFGLADALYKEQVPVATG